MTDAEKDAVWRSLPESFKKEVRGDYSKALDAQALDPWNDRINVHMIFLEKYFGKHNLTATEEEFQDKTMNKDELLKLRKERGKQTLNIGDKVRVISASGKPLYDGKVATVIEKGMSCNEVYYGLYIEGVTVEKRSTPLIGKSEIIGNTSLLAPFFAEDLELVTSHTEEKKPSFKVGDLVLVKKEFDFGSNFGLAYVFCVIPHLIKEIAGGKAFLQNDWDGSPNSEYTMIPLDYLIPYTEPQEPPLKATAADGLIQMAKDEMGIVDNDTPKTNAPDWLAYRMELAKEVTPKVISALSDNGVSSDFCESVIDKVTTIVEGIVERLKGGEK